MILPRLLLAGAASASIAFGATQNYGTSTLAPEIPAAQPGPAYLQLAPMLGHISATDARIWVKATAAAKVSIRVSDRADLADAREVAGPALAAEQDFAGAVVVDSLKPATRYFYSVLLDGQPAIARPWPAFTTAPEVGAKGRVRFGFGSCVGKDPWLDAAMWAQLDAAVPMDLFLLLGDNHYANTTDAAKQRAAFIAHRSNAGFRSLFQRISLYGIWDDHDFGVNDSDGSQQGKEISLRTFQEFFANPAAGEPDNPGVYFKFSRGDVDFFMLDGRYHRSPNLAPDDGTKTLLGAKQLAWLKRELLASTARIRVLGIGGEWQRHGTPDSWQSFATERDELFAFFAEHEMKNLILLSGDRHFTSGYQVDGRFIEVSSGPLGSPSVTPKSTAETFLNYGEGKLACVFEIDTTGEQPTAALEIYQAGGGLLEKRTFSWNEISGAAKIAPSLPSPKAATKPAAR